MAFSAKFGIWIVQGNGKESSQFRIYVNPNDTIYKIKQNVAERTKTEEKIFCLFKSDHTELEDDKTVEDFNIRAGDKLKKEDKKPYKCRRSNTGPDRVAPSPYQRPLIIKGIIRGNYRHQMIKSNSDTSIDDKYPKGSTNDTRQQKKPQQDKSKTSEDYIYISKSQEIKKSSQAETDLPIEKVIPLVVPIEQKQKPDNIGNEKSENSFTRECRGECLMSPDDIPNLLYRTAVDCQHKWYMMGSLLGLSIEELVQIREIHSNSPGNCYADMISRYVSSKQLRPTWHLITKYLMQPLEQYDLGMLFRKEYCKDCCYIEDELKYEN